MRASKKAKGQNLLHHEMHISGAEGIYADSEILKAAQNYIQRALNHSRGRPDSIVITVEEINQKCDELPLLPLKTIECASPDEARDFIYQMLTDTGISEKAIAESYKIITSEGTMRGASLIDMVSGKRLEKERDRGVRVSRFGIERESLKILSRRLSRLGINNNSVKEALTLASKVASHPDVAAEVCISDDPDYTTGYIASKFGYQRITNIKREGDMRGGRVFFIKSNSNVTALADYLEKKPVILILK
ncbi:MAG: 6-carboxyhexanoate--CoA ligase [Nitrospirae bacterium]|nr:6-carboxyhexanoate--CoA ligase [Nitrospirota bacterium]